MTRKLEASGHIRRKPAPSDKRASVVELTDSGKTLTDQIKQLWCALAEETVTGLPTETVAELPNILRTLTGNVDTRHHRYLPGTMHGLAAKSPQAGHVDQASASTGVTALTGDYEPSALGWVRDHVEQILRTGTTDGVG
jgi:hypothetical protein